MTTTQEQQKQQQDYWKMWEEALTLLADVFDMERGKTLKELHPEESAEQVEERRQKMVALIRQGIL